MVLSKLSLTFFLLHMGYFPPLPHFKPSLSSNFFVSHFPCSMQISFPLCLTVSCDDAATSDLSLDLRSVALHVSLCAYVCLLVLREDAYPFNTSLTPSLFVVTSVTVLLRQLSHHSS